MKTLDLEIPVAVLKDVLPGLGKIIGRKHTLPVLGCVRAFVDESGTIKLQATDLNDFATVTLAEKHNGPAGEMLVPYDALSKSVKGCPADQTIRLMGTSKATTLSSPIGDNRIERQLAYVDPKEWPSAPVVKEQGINLSQEVKDALMPAFDAASTDDSRYVLQSAYLDVEDPKAHYVVATNGQVLFSANSFRLDLKESLIIPHRKFLRWPGFLSDGECRVSIQSQQKNKTSWLQFASDRWTLVTKQVDLPYPKWKEALPKDVSGTQLTFSDAAMQNILSAVNKLPGTDGIRLITQSGELILQARQSDKDAWTNLPVLGVKVEGNPLEVSLDRSYLAQALKLGLNEVEFHHTLAVFKKEGRRLVVVLKQQESKNTQPAPADTTPASENIQPTEERKPMPKTATTPQEPTVAKPVSAFDQLQEQIEHVRTTMRELISELGDVLKTVAQAHKEKKITEKEIESIRASLKEIQRIKV